MKPLPILLFAVEMFLAAAAVVVVAENVLRVGLVAVRVAPVRPVARPVVAVAAGNSFVHSLLPAVAAAEDYQQVHLRLVAHHLRPYWAWAQLYQ